MADPPQSPQPPDLAESLKRQWDAFGAWGYERHTRWGDATLISPRSWAMTLALTLAALIFCIVGLERHSDLWEWMSGHRHFFFVVQAIGALGLGLLCLWLLAVRPLTRRSAQLAAALITMLVVAGLALLCDRANDALMTAGGTLLLTIAWRLTAMNTWGPHIARDLIAQSRRIERPVMPSLPQPQDTSASPAAADPALDTETTDVAADGDQSATLDQPSTSDAPPALSQPTTTTTLISLNTWFVLTVAGALLLIAAFTLPMLSISFGGFGSASATLEDLARLLEADEGGISSGTVLAWQFGWGTITYAALATAIGLVGWLNLARFRRSVLAILLLAGPMLFVIQLIGVVLLTDQADAGSALVVGTSGFWINTISFAAIVLSVWRLGTRDSA